MLDISAILKQTTEILNAPAEDHVFGSFDTSQMLDGVGLDTEFARNFPVGDPGDILAQMGIEDGLPVDPSILAHASDVLSGRSVSE